MKYTLEERTIQFAECIIEVCSKIRPSFISKNCLSQILRSATSVGANYMEANGASSRKDFRNKISLCKKEIQETKFWLRMLKKCTSYDVKSIETLEKEAHELNLIFQKIKSTLDKSKNEN